MNKNYSFNDFKDQALKARAEKERELGYSMLDTDRARKICTAQIERNIQQAHEE